MKNRISVRKLVTVAILGAVSTVLMYLEFPLPFLIPPFVKFDFADVPSLLAAYSMGPAAGATVCLIRCAVHLAVTHSAGAGELANFILGCCLAVPAGIIYRQKKTRTGAIIGASAGALTMAGASLPVNLFITYPFYMSAYGMSEESIMELYRLIIPSTKDLLSALLIFNMPFTLLKGVVAAAATLAVFTRISPLINEKR